MSESTSLADQRQPSAPRKDRSKLNTSSGQVTVLLGNGQGAYTQSASFGASPSLALATADFDEDGNADLVWPNPALERYEIAYGNGDGTFDAPTVFNPAESVSPYLLAAGLFTPGDSHADLAVVGQAATGETVFRLFPGHGNGTFADSKKKVISATVPALALAAGGDVDGDGRTDFAVALDSGTVQVVRSIEASPGLELGAALSIAQGTKPRSVLIADLDNDGDADVATGNSGFYFDETGLAQDPPPAGWVSRFLNDGTGTFAADSPIPVGDYPTDLAFGDLNGDGYADLALTHLPYFDGDIAPVGVQVLLSNGVGGFLGPEETFTGWAPFSLVITDVNGDGLNDMVDADVATSQVTVLRNYLNVASNERARPKVMFARERPAPRKRVDGLRVASASPLTVTDVVPAAFPLPSTVANNRPYWYHNDHLGTPQVMTDQAGLVVWKGYYQPFGEATTPIEDVVNAFRFPGQYEDGESGQNYSWWRQFAGDVGRYLQFDPLELSSIQPMPISRPAALAAYTYGRNDPLTTMDLTGLEPTTIKVEGCDRGCLRDAEDQYALCKLTANIVAAQCAECLAGCKKAGPLKKDCALACSLTMCAAVAIIRNQCNINYDIDKQACCWKFEFPSCTSSGRVVFTDPGGIEHRPPKCTDDKPCKA
ncbi:MAG: FG-GAP-like repeat-containing protein [bacterium]